MNLERRALYNSLRMNWLNDSNIVVEPWQVEDYRALPLHDIFERLRLQDFFLDRISFANLADQFETPEDFTDDLLAETQADPVTYDQVYLLIFELWRRLLPEKPTLSIFCDELDHQIFLYDSGKANNVEAIQDILANLEVVLDENADEGIDPAEVFATICHGCANDVESFLYDFIVEQIDAGNISYASELLEDLGEYLTNVKWFEFLKVKIMFASEPDQVQPYIKQLLKDHLSQNDLEFNLELLSFLVQAGGKEDFFKLVKATIPLLEKEEDFQDLLTICADFYHRLDLDDTEATLQNLIAGRTRKSLDAPFDRKDLAVGQLFAIMK